jgi:hypothetical protein
VHRLPLSGVGTSGKNDHVMAALGKIARQNSADLAAATGYNNAQRPFCWKAAGVHR